MVRLSARHERRQASTSQPAEERQYAGLSLLVATLQFVLHAMAIGGLPGSNLFDFLIIAIDDVFYTMGPVLADVFSAAMMSGAILVGLVYRPRHRVLRTMSVVSAALLAMHLVSVSVLSVHRE